MLSSVHTLDLKSSRGVNAPTFTHTAQASIPSLFASSSQQQPSIPSYISPSSVFYQVLTAAYRPPATPRVRQSNPVDSKHAEMCHESVDWTRQHSSPEAQVDRDADGADGTNASTPTILERQIYKPHGRWSWADGLSINDTKELMQLGCGTTCSVTLKRGTLGTRQVTYVSRCWNTLQPDRWYGFYSELALYQTECYLKRLQGNVLPWIIGVHVLPGAISIAMEPPHHSFWIEASADMPAVLKKRCIDAFEKIHERGVLHGDVELRHMLIGGDGRVTIIDFRTSRALVPNADVMLLEAEPQELKLEMRKVKYKLDYEGARKREAEKMARSEEQDRRSRASQMDREAEPYHEGILEEDIVDPPVHIQDWNERWANAAADATPTRFVMPDQTPEALAKEFRSFFALLDYMSTASALKPERSEHRQVRFTSEITSADYANIVPSGEPFTGSPTHSYGLRKRKLPDSLTSGGSTHDTRFAKRSRSKRDLASPASMEEEEDEDQPIRPGLLADPVLVNYMANETIDKDRFTPPRTAPADIFKAPDPLLADPSRFPPIKVRDFAYEPYSGPRGYYAPYPLMEAAVSLHRRRWIRLQNEQRCAELGLPFSRRRTTPRSSSPSIRRQSKSDMHIMRFALGLSQHRKMEGIPASTHKRKRGDEEAEMLEADFAEDSRRAKKVLASADRNAYRLSSQVGGPSTGPSADLADLHSVQHPQERVAWQQSQHHTLLGSRTDQIVPADRAMSLHQSVSSKHSSSKHSRVGDRIAFSTLWGLPPTSRIKSNSKTHAHLSNFDASHKDSSTSQNTSQSGIRTPPRRKKDHHPSIPILQQPVDRCLSPSSEDEVEALICPSPAAVDAPSSLTQPGSWIGFLLRWIQ